MTPRSVSTASTRGDGESRHVVTRFTWVPSYIRTPKLDASWAKLCNVITKMHHLGSHGISLSIPAEGKWKNARKFPGNQLQLQHFKIVKILKNKRNMTDCRKNFLFYETDKELLPYTQSRDQPHHHLGSKVPPVYLWCWYKDTFLLYLQHSWCGTQCLWSLSGPSCAASG